MITQLQLKECVTYDSETGIMTWIKRPISHFKTPNIYASFNSRCLGKEVGHITDQNYRVTIMMKRRYSVHILAWLYVTGDYPRYPEQQIDHINGIRDDNKFINLRLVTRSQNQRNQCMRTDNKSGVNGVNWKSDAGKWVARIWDGPNHRFLGYFSNLEDAAEARAKAELELGYHHGHGKERKYS